MAKLCQLAYVNAAHEREHPLPCDAQDDAAQPHREAPDIISGSLLPRMYPTAEHLSRAVRAAESIHRLVSGPAVPRRAALARARCFDRSPGARRASHRRPRVCRTARAVRRSSLPPFEHSELQQYR